MYQNEEKRSYQIVKILATDVKDGITSRFSYKCINQFFCNSACILPNFNDILYTNSYIQMRTI